MDKANNTITEVSEAILRMDQSRMVRLSSGRCIEVTRLNWLQFEVVWPDLAGVVSALATLGGDPDDREPAAGLICAPACLAKLAILSTELSEEEVSRLDFNDVLLIATAAIELNFVETAGVRSFFAVLGRLAPDPGSTPTR